MGHLDTFRFICLSKNAKVVGGYVKSLGGLGFHAQQQVKYHITPPGAWGSMAPWLTKIEDNVDLLLVTPDK